MAGGAGRTYVGRCDIRVLLRIEISRVSMPLRAHVRDGAASLLTPTNVRTVHVPFLAIHAEPLHRQADGADQRDHNGKI